MNEQAQVVLYIITSLVPPPGAGQKEAEVGLGADQVADGVQRCLRTDLQTPRASFYSVYTAGLCRSVQVCAQVCAGYQTLKIMAKRPLDLGIPELLW